MGNKNFVVVHWNRFGGKPRVTKFFTTKEEARTYIDEDVEVSEQFTFYTIRDYRTILKNLIKQYQGEPEGKTRQKLTRMLDDTYK